MNLKACNQCGVLKPNSDFKKQRNAYRARCRECENRAARERYAEDPSIRQRIVEANKKYEKPYREWTEKYKERVRERKRMSAVRAMAGYKPAKHQAHVHAYKAHIAEIEREQRRERYKAWLVNQKAEPLTKGEQLLKWRRDEKHQVEVLSNRYVTRLLKKGVPTLMKGVKLPKSLIDLERVRLMIVREVRKRNRNEELQIFAR